LLLNLNNGKFQLTKKDKKPKSKFKKWLLATLAFVCAAFLCLAVTVAVLFKQVPEAYVPPIPPEPNAPIPQFVTRDIVATVYNESQLAKPFDLVVPQDEINALITNKAVTNLEWPIEINGVVISSPAVLFQPDTLSVMATIDYAGVPVVMTFIAEPKLETDGMLYLNIRQVKAGLMDITPLAKGLASSIFSRQAQKYPDEPIIKMLADACLENKPIDPVFPAFKKYIRIIATDIQVEKMILRCKSESRKKLTSSR